MAKKKQKLKRNFNARINSRRRLPFYGLLLVIAVAVGIGLYFQANHSQAAQPPFLSHIKMNIPGNNSNQAQGTCTWSCFKPEITEVSVRIVPVACSSLANQQARDWCTDIDLSGNDLATCRTYPVTSGSQTVSSGDVVFTPFGPNAGQNTGQIHYKLYAAAGSSCGITYVADVGGTPQYPDVYFGVVPSCGSALGASCPSPGDGGDDDGGDIGDGVRNGSTGDGNGTGGTGAGANGTGRGGGANGGNGLANEQADQPNPSPDSSSQGDQKQPEVKPSPFFDGKLFATGSSVKGPLTISSAGEYFSAYWPYVLGGVGATGGAAAGIYYWYWRRGK